MAKFGNAARLGGRFWLDKENSRFLGHGRVQLLEMIAQCGSISAAARAMGMSYKAAWDAVDAMNNLSDEPLVVRSTGGRRGGGTRLTEHGLRTVELFRRIEREYQSFLAHLSEGIGDFDRYYELIRRFSLKTSARNQYQGCISRVVKGAVNSEVVLALPGGDELVAVVTNESVECLQLREGTRAHAMVKESAVMLAPAAEALQISARNRLCGRVVRCQEGAVNGEVRLELPGGKAVTAIITNQSICRLGIKEGGEVCALIKASDVILAISD